MSLSFNIDQIKWFLSIPENNKELTTFFDEWNISLEYKQNIIDKLLSYINHFTMFRDIEPLMNSVFVTIKKTLEFKIHSYEFNDGGGECYDYGKPVGTIEEAVRLLELAEIAKPAEEWFIRCDVQTDIKPPF